VKKSFVRLIVAGMLVATLIATLPASASVIAPSSDNWYGPAVGPQPWIVLLCSFKGSEPRHEVGYYQTLFGDQYPNMGDYWTTVSYGRMDFQPDVRGWYEMPRKLAFYKEDPGYFGGIYTNTDALTKHCQAQANDDVDFTDYKGAVYFFDKGIGNTGYGGPGFRYFDVSEPDVWSHAVMGEPLDWGTWTTTPQGSLAHEMGHGFGFRHSGARDDVEYGSPWDVMSNIAQGCWEEPFECIPVHPIAAWKREAGWITDSEVYVPEEGTTTTVTLEATGSQLLLPGRYRMIQAPIRGTETRWLTVEVRADGGKYEDLPGSGVIVHRISTKDYSTKIIDLDQNGDATDGALLTEGEFLIDNSSGIKVTAGAPMADGSMSVTIYSPPRDEKTYERRVRLGLFGGLELRAHLDVVSGPKECYDQVRVVGQMKRDGDWVDVKAFRVDSVGFGTIHVYGRNRHRGWYRLVAPATTSGWDTCEQATSKPVWYEGL
jgi:M6 family metalloprotease-like protein